MTTALESLDERCLALAAIGAQGAPSPGELAGLREALRAEAAPLRTAAARALGDLLGREGALGERLADEISRELVGIATHDLHLWTRQAAASTLSRATAAALEPLEAALQSDDGAVRERAARAAGHWGRGPIGPETTAAPPPGPRAHLAEIALAAALGDAHPGVCIAAAEALGALPALGPSVEALAAMALHPRPVDSRIAALDALADAGAIDHDAAFGALEATLIEWAGVEPDRPRSAREAATAAAEIDRLLVAALEAATVARRPDRAARLLTPVLRLVRSQTEPDAVRVAALGALSSLGAEAAGALDDVMAAAGHRSWAVREQAVEAFGELAAGDLSFVEARLPALVASNSPGERYVGLRLLHRLGALPAPLVPAVWAAALEEPDLRTRELARELAGGTLGHDDALPERLLASLGNARPVVRARAAEFAGRLGPAASPLVPALVGALPDSSRKVRRAAVGALGAIGAAALPGVPPALRRAFEGERTVADAARASLKALAPELAPALRARVTAAIGQGKSEVLLLGLLDQGLPDGLEAEFLTAARARAGWHASLRPDAPAAAEGAAVEATDAPADAPTPAPDAPPARRAALAALAAADEAAGRRTRRDSGPGAREREAAWLLAFLVRGLMAQGH
jgi:hypothetical protein